MNVSELISELQKYPQDMNVRIYPTSIEKDIDEVYMSDIEWEANWIVIWFYTQAIFVE